MSPAHEKVSAVNVSPTIAETMNFPLAISPPKPKEPTTGPFGNSSKINAKTVRNNVGYYAGYLK